MTGFHVFMTYSVMYIYLYVSNLYIWIKHEHTHNHTSFIHSTDRTGLFQKLLSLLTVCSAWIHFYLSYIPWLYVNSFITYFTGLQAWSATGYSTLTLKVTLKVMVGIGPQDNYRVRGQSFWVLTFPLHLWNPYPMRHEGSWPCTVAGEKSKGAPG